MDASEFSPQSVLPAAHPCNGCPSFRRMLAEDENFFNPVPTLYRLPPAAIFDIAARASAISERSDPAALFSSAE